jgi:hypothetical protein
MEEMKKTYYIAGIEIPTVSIEQVGDAIDEMFPTDVLDTLDRNRPYNGQPLTDTGDRGKHEVKGITMRDS